MLCRGKYPSYWDASYNLSSALEVCELENVQNVLSNEKCWVIISNLAITDCGTTGITYTSSKHSSNVKIV